MASQSTERQMFEVKVDVRPFYWEPIPSIQHETITEAEEQIIKDQGPITRF